MDLFIVLPACATISSPGSSRNGAGDSGPILPSSFLRGRLGKERRSSAACCRQQHISFGASFCPSFRFELVGSLPALAFCRTNSDSPQSIRKVDRPCHSPQVILSLPLCFSLASPKGTPENLAPPPPHLPSLEELTPSTLTTLLRHNKHLPPGVSVTSVSASGGCQIL